ncbi:MAG: 2-phospho-L-lactate transferase [Anaerolineaceae bacterium]|nr:2-phospho-L-lactate transferase [Anaerolineaceae bacterium]
MKVVALAGGVGGAKLVSGLAQSLGPQELTVIVNTGDDFWHLGLRICPDLDTVCYTLAGLANKLTGWGREGETWRVIEELKRFDGADWFKLGDRDLALHLYRTGLLAAGKNLTEVVAELLQIWDVETVVLPMSDDPVATMVFTENGEMAFQEYFVKYQWQPKVKGFRFLGADNALPTKEVISAIEEAKVVIIAPSNPWVSIGPILSVSGMKELLKTKNVIAVSPLIGGRAVKGPAAKMYHELGLEPSSSTVARQYQDVINGFVLDTIDAQECEIINVLGIGTFLTDIMMRDYLDRKRLADEVLDMSRKTWVH